MKLVSSCARLVCVGSVVLIALTLRPDQARAETSANFPSSCKPLGTFACSSAHGTKWQYTAPCLGPYDNETAVLSALHDAYDRPNNCSTSVTVAGSWLSGGPHAINWCGGTTNYPSLPLRSANTGIEVQNFRPFNVTTVYSLPGCQNTQSTNGHYAKSRSVVCPAGMVGANDGFGFYCRGPNETKDLCDSCGGGGGGGGTSVGNPINAGTGNKYQIERDYQGPGPDPLIFDRFYNSAGKWHAQTASYGPEWFTRIGLHWRHTYDRTIKFVESSTLTTAFVYRPDGRIFFFNLYNNSYYTDADINSRLVRLISAGTPIGWEYHNADDSVEIYDGDGKLTSISYRSGVTQSLAYDAAGRLGSVIDSFGRQLTFAYDANDRVSTVTDPAGGDYIYSYDSAGRLSTVTDPEGAVRTYVYNESAHTSNVNLPHALTGIVDENTERFATFDYASDGRAIGSAHAGGAGAVALIYNANGTATVTDALGTPRTYTFQTILGVKKVTAISQPCVSCGAAAAVYDANGNATSRSDFEGNVTNVSYDVSRNLPTSRTEAVGTSKSRTISTSWHPIFRIPAQVDEPNRRTTFLHDAHGNVLTKTITDLSVTASVSRTWAYTYNSYGRVLTEDGPRTDVSDITAYAYNTCTTGFQCGQVHTVTNALGQVTTFNVYNAHGQPLTITDPNGVVTTLTYDSRQRLTSRSVVGEATTFAYWPTGLLKKVTLPDSGILLYTYDDAHRLTKIEDGEGNRLEYTLDAMGNRTAESAYDPSNALSRTRTQVFNSLNQLWKQIGAAGTAAVTTVYGYDNNGNQTSVAAPLGRTTSNQFDELNRLKQITDPGSGITQFGYDANDNLTSVTDPRGLVTSYTYNGLGDLTQQVSPDTGTTVNTYDSGGNLAISTDARSKAGTYSYDALNRVTQLAYPDRTITFSYDSGSNGIGRLTGASDANHSLSWAYDAQGRVTTRSQTVGAVTKSVTYGYTNGNLASVTTPSGQVIGYGYTDGRITSVNVNGATILNQVLYDPFGPVRQWTWGNSTLTDRSYDLDGNPSAFDSAGATTYAVDDAFRIAGIADLGDSSLSWTYGYDLLDRINAAARSGQTIGYTYDANGNRLTQTGTAPATYTVSSTSNRLASITGSQARTYTYDAAGNATGYAGLSFTYEDSGRLRSETVGGVATTYTLNALGQRVKKSGPSATALFVYDEAGHLLGEYDGSGGLIQETVWLNDTPVATLRPNGAGVSIYYVHTDHLNTPRRITRPTDNAIVWRWDSDPFGNTAANEDPDGDAGSFVYNLRLPGQYYDTESGLNYNYFRDYDPYTGRYLQSDPIGLRGGINTYAYALSNPINKIDPYGLQTSDYIACVIRQVSSSGLENCEEQFGNAVARALNEIFCDTVTCTTRCVLVNFVGKDFEQALVKAHTQMVTKVLDKIAKETASKAAKKLLPVVGQIDFVNDAIGTVKCTTDCIKN